MVQVKRSDESGSVESSRRPREERISVWHSARPSRTNSPRTLIGVGGEHRGVVNETVPGRVCSARFIQLNCEVKLVIAGSTTQTSFLKSSHREREKRKERSKDVKLRFSVVFSGTVMSQLRRIKCPLKFSFNGVIVSLHARDKAYHPGGTYTPLYGGSSAVVKRASHSN
ncbi:uncharacterized protein LOC117227620 [Megalopta genalis]|uniref:uncharacterized protein LOC117227620 n=1 Tax=Megalopta genalis TaxID=115081 RepID=UPI003FD35508